VSISASASETCRHLVLRASGGEPIPDAVVRALREHGVHSGWLRASGVLSDVELRAYDPELGALGTARRIAGPVHVLSMEGAIGRSEGEPGFSMRAVLARESDLGLLTVAGEIVQARAVALEILVTALDDVALERTLDAAGVWLVSDGEGAPAAKGVADRAPRAPARAPASPAWSAALEASEDAPPPAMRPRAATSPAGSAAGPSTAAIPPRPIRPGPDLDSPFPEPGDVVDHFAFGVCDVLRSDGDRLHLKVRKDGRIREIALEMLRVSPMSPPADAGDGKRRFKLERRI
jgi:predicted DNA-binding protein with PD1-like motif